MCSQTSSGTSVPSVEGGPSTSSEGVISAGTIEIEYFNREGQYRTIRMTLPDDLTEAVLPLLIKKQDKRFDKIRKWRRA